VVSIGFLFRQVTRLYDITTNSYQAAMWDSHFRVGGATGTNLQLADCPTGASSVNSKCMAASLLFHITKQASGYFENVWAWTADHDLDNPGNADAYESPEGIPLSVTTQISIYSGRGMLIESQGPTWLYGTASEHSQMYQYQLSGAKNIYLGHMQTETPYYQPNPVATKPYIAGTGNFTNDPDFASCTTDQCRSAWALRIVNTTDVFIYGAGFYSFFQNNQLGCTAQETCQLGLIQTNYSQGLWIYNIFTKGNVQIVSPAGGLPPLLFNDTTSDGYTSEIAAWLALSTGGGNLGTNGNGTGGGNVVYIDPGILPSSYGGHGSPSGATVTCSPPCTYVLPPLTLPSPTTINFGPSSTSLEVGCFVSSVYTNDFDGQVSTTSFYVAVTVTTTLTVPATTLSILPFSNVPIVSGISTTVIAPVPSIVAPPFVVTDNTAVLASAGITCISSGPVSRTITPKPWPYMSFPVNSTTSPTSTSPTPPLITVTHTTGGQGPTCSGGCGSTCTTHCSNPCSSGCNTNGASCSASTCTQGGDCAGPTCTAGGDCDGPACTRGGDCTGPKCDHGGHCNGPHCHRGGSCWGLFCHHGGDCIGPFCDHGGGCGPPLIGCPPGNCVGPHCHSPGDDDDNDNDGSGKSCQSTLSDLRERTNAKSSRFR
jgi:glucan 1,3-beta-glucosidase